MAFPATNSSLSLRQRMMTLLGVTYLIMMVLVLFSVLGFIYATERRTWEERQSEAAQNAAEDVSEYLQGKKDVLEFLDKYGYDELLSSRENLRRILLENPALMEIAFLDENGRIVQNASQGEPVIARQFTVLQAEWFWEARSGRTYYSKIQSSPAGSSYLIFAMPSIHGGVVAAQIRMDELWETVANIRFGRSGRVFVVSEDGRIIAHSDRENVLSNRSIGDTSEFGLILSAPGSRWVGNRTNLEGVKVLSVSTTVEGSGWIVITELPLREVHATSRLALLVISVILLTILTVTTYISMKSFFRDFLRPIEILRQGALRLGQGDLSHRLTSPHASDELGEVITVFNQMAADLERQRENLQKAIAYEYEYQRAQELDILLKASEATSSSLDLDKVLLALASQLLELSGFQSCYISEWDRAANRIFGRTEHSRTIWSEEKREYYSLREYPHSMQVLQSGTPMMLQGDFEAEEKQWMSELGRTALLALALRSKEQTLGLVEIASTKKGHLFDPAVLPVCLEILSDAAEGLVEPLSVNDSKLLFDIQERLLAASGGEICSLSEWEQAGNRIFAHSVVADIVWDRGESPSLPAERDPSWKLALQDGKASVLLKPDGEQVAIGNVTDGGQQLQVESLIVFPLQKGNERLGMVELYDFNHKTSVSPERLALLRTIADKASYSIENARLLQATEKRLKEKEILLKEVHHRVKNNLQVISSLLNLQLAHQMDEVNRTALRDSQSRVRSMALVHEKLYRSASLETIDIGEYVQSLAAELVRFHQPRLRNVRIVYKMEKVFLNLDHAISCGLLLNELITNALKYAFPSDRQGSLLLEIKKETDGMVCIRVADDGVGLPESLDIHRTQTLGLELVMNLARQLKGTVDVDRFQGTDFRIRFMSDPQGPV